jgi:nicotinate-nucleotide adenylyltransferase
MLRVGIYGGAFAPIHIGHVEAAKAFIEQMWLDVLFVVPTGKSPHKEMDTTASDKDRIEMCRRAFEGVEGVIVSDVEIRRGDTSYSIETLRSFTDDDRRLFMLCGTDMMLTLGEWHDADEIFRLCYPVYIRREEDRALDKKIIETNTKYFETYGKYVIKLDAPVIDISSSQLREMMRRGEDVSEYIPARVLEYIDEVGLYR